MFQPNKAIIRIVFGTGCTVLCNLEGWLFGDHAREVLERSWSCRDGQVVVFDGSVVLCCLNNLGTVSHTEFMWHW